MAVLMYGAGLRLIECLRLRVKDVDFEGKELTVREGKGRKDRLTMLTAAAVTLLQEHLARVKEQHDQDLRAGYGTVTMPWLGNFPTLIKSGAVSMYSPRRNCQKTRALASPSGITSMKARDKKK